MDGSEALAAYLPTEIRYALAGGFALPDRPEGAVLGADISGFTPLSAAFAEELGPARGAEELTRQLEAAFASLIEPVQTHRGSVIAFAGDAVTCWFDAAEAGGSMSEAVVRAAGAALAIQRGVAALPAITTPAGRTFPLAVRVALAAGAVRRFVVGDPAVQRLAVLAGHVVDRMAAVDRLAQPGEVVVGEEVITALGEGAELAEWRPHDTCGRVAVLQGLRREPAPCPWPAAPALAAELLRPWLLRPVSERVERGEGAFLAGFKPVVALFFGFAGIDYDADPQAEAHLDAVIRRLQEIVGGRGGHLIDLNTGDKGSHVFAAFGALRAHEDAPRRALAAALALRALPADLPFLRSVRIGVAQSRVYTGALGCAARRTFSVVGSEVNVAARLMALAVSGDILATSRIATAVGTRFTLAPQKAVQLKGLPEALTPFRVLGERDIAAGDPLDGGAGTLAGRLQERRVLEDGLEALRAGRGGCIVVEGEPGIGKSRLLAHVRARAGARGVTTLMGSGDPLRRAAPYHPWRTVFERSLGIGPNGGAARTTRVIERLAALGAEGDGPATTLLAPLLNTVLDLDLPESDATRHVEGQVRADNTRDLLVRILRAGATSGPQLLLLEDLHWFDSASASLVGLVARDVPSMLIVATRRPPADRPAASLADALSAAGARTLSIGRLERAAVEALLCEALGVASLPLPALALIERKGEGSPFYSRELAFTLRDAGHLAIVDGTCCIAPAAGDLSELDFPDTIQGVIASRIDALSTSQQLAAKVASVVGRRFSERIVHDVHPVPEDRQALPETLSALERAHLTVRDAVATEPGYLFQHVLTQEVAYSLLLHSQRQTLHEAVAGWYERRYGDDLAPHYAVLAHHASRAVGGRTGDATLLGRALGYVERAGTQALRSSSNEEAVRLFSEAVALDESAPRTTPAADGVSSASRRAAWFGGLARAYLALSRFDDSTRATVRALELLGRRVPKHSLGLVASGLRQLGRQVLTRLRRRPVGDPTLDASEHRRLTEINQLLWILSKSLYHANDTLRILWGNLHSLNLSERLGAPDELALVYSHGMLTLGTLQVHGWARAYGRWAQDAARRAGNPGRLVTVLVNEGVYHLGRCEWDEVQAALDEGRAVARELGDDSQWGECTALLADAALFRGDVAGSRRLYAEVFRTADRRGHQVPMSWCMRPQVVGALREGRPDDAVDRIESSRQLWAGVQDRLLRIDALGLLALARLRTGDHAAALAAVTEARALIPTVSPPVAYPRLLGYTAIAEVCLDAWEDAMRGGHDDGGALQRLARRACRDLDVYRRSFRLGLPAARLSAGRYHWLRGRRRRARRRVRQALDAASTLGMRYEEGRAHHLLGRFAAAESVEQQDHLRRAECLFAALGATYDLERVRADARAPLGKEPSP